ncbi:MAG: transglutaminase-like cysteine peptidase [Hyphomicrobiales bacterium]|nr:transglutaminase-like cysteine peptidase [Hyphomicrobiales bacterium]
MFGPKSVLNVTAFVATFTALASTNIPLLRAMAVASISTGSQEHRLSVAFDIPALDTVQPNSASLPPIPAPFDGELVLKEPEVTTAAIEHAAKPLPFGGVLVPKVPEVTTAAIEHAPKPAPKPSRPATAMSFGLFGSLEFRTNATKGTRTWRTALARLDNEQPLYEFCDIGMLNCPPKYVAWRQLLAAIRGLPTHEQLARLNQGVNALISHGEDADIFRVRDHWAAPMEFLQTGGDCEDYTILKYASLLELGYSDHQLRIAVVRDTRRRQDHAVLAVASSQGVIVLDSLTDTPVPHGQIRHYNPVYSVNRANRWVHIATKQISRLSVDRARSF